MTNNWVEGFLLEAEGLLADIEGAALSLNGTTDSGESIAQIFRAFHTIKGSGAMCGLDRVAQFTHHIETLLDSVREGATPVSAQLIDLVLAAVDHIRGLLLAEQAGNRAPDGPNAKLIGLLQHFHIDCGSAPSAPPVASAQQPETTAAVQLWEIEFRPAPMLFDNGGNPLLLIRELEDLGPVEVLTRTDLVPSIEDLDPDTCYLRWTIRLATAADENAIRDVFMFVEDGAELRIRRLSGSELDPSSHSPAPADKSSSSLSPQEIPAADSRKNPPRPTASTTIKSVTRESVVRVPSGRLDHLVNLVGELVMNQSRLAQAASHAGATELATPVEEMERLITELRDDVLGIRMLPIGTIFGRFRRLVHDLSAELGKEVDLVTEGEETELDKSILDQLGEPLVHLLRNSIDHGIEPSEIRAQLAKPQRGTIRLSAVHTGSDVVVSIEDDGKGINRAAVHAKAIERKLIAPDANLSDQELLKQILQPGFSTAQQITSVSGRGVGMDVVKKQIDALRGYLLITSEEGRNTKIALHLPLTLAIIEGLIVQIGVDQFIIPMASVTENVELEKDQRAQKNGRNLVTVRGDLVPYIDLRETFRIDGEAPEIEKVVIVRQGDERVGLVVDRVLGTHQTVLQSLGRFFRNIDVVSGATIMGDGSVALILDVAAVVGFIRRQSERALSMPHTSLDGAPSTATSAYVH